MISPVRQLADDFPSEQKTPTRRWRFAVVLLAALLVSAGQPLVSELLGDQSSFDFGVTLLIMAVLLLAFEPGTHRSTARALGVAAFASLCAAKFASGASISALVIVSHLLTACLFALTLWSIIRTILFGRTSGEAILAAVCGYLLLGIIWSLIYESVETAAPGSFRVAAANGNQKSIFTIDRSELGYFSFVTLSTVGYGDVLPTTRVARTLAWLEAVVGQFYLAVLVAGLVGLRVSQGKRQRNDE